MKRNVSLEEISDGRLYDENDLVKVGCQDCAGCSACCQGMGDTVLLDPLDAFRLSAGLHKAFQELVGKEVELGVADGLILPHLAMNGPQEKCGFLNAEGRCSVHPFRPGICRLFPLGRYYEEGTYRYFLQVKECEKKNRTKMKVSKWIDTPQPAKYKEFVLSWHYFLKDCEKLLEEQQEEELGKNLSLYLLKLFYFRPYDEEMDFYDQFAARLNRAAEDLF